MKYNSYWKTMTLGEAVNFRRGHDLPKTKMNDGIVPVVASNGIIGYHNEYTTKAPCITIGRSGNTGKPQYFNKNCWAHNTTLYIDDYKGNDPKFIYYLLQTLNLSNYQGGSAVPTLNRNHIHPIKITIPIEINIQKSIAKILSYIDNKIELNNQLNDNLVDLMNVMFQERFADHDEMKQRPLYELANFINGTSFKPDEYDTAGIPIIKIVELKNGITKTTQYFSGEKDKKYYIKNGDILFSWSGNPETSIDTFIWHDGSGILNQHTFKVVPKENEDIYIYLMLKFFKPIFSAIASNKQTTGLGHVTVADLKRLTFFYDEEKVKDFNELVKPVYLKLYNNLIENGKFEVLRDTLLPKLMSGKINLDKLEPDI